MAVSLILALMAIAGLGILALCLIFFGGRKRRPNKRQAVAKEKTTIKKFEKEEAKKSGPQEPYISENIIAEVEAPNKNISAKQDEIDPAIASLGFSAIDDLLIEPETTTIGSTESDSQPTIAIPAKFKPKPKIKKNAVEQDVIVLYVMASPEQPFVGYELMQAVVAAGMRFGKMDIFHRYAEDNSEQTIFSMCSAVEPGVFDMANIGALTCHGLSLFMRISAVEDPAAGFNLLLETAEQLAYDLAGTVCDEKRKPLTDEKLLQYQEMIQQSLEYA